jgi:subfamily B ATP-binding cassette protein MsbA
VKSYFQILKLAFRYKGHAALNVLFNLLYVLFNLASLLVFIPFLSLLFKDPETAERVSPPNWDTMSLGQYLETYVNYEMQTYIEVEGKKEALFFICIAVAVLFFAKNVARYLAMFFLAAIRNSVVRDIRKKLYNKIVKLPIGYYSDERKGDILARTTSDVQEVDYSIMSTLELLFREPLAIIISISIMIYWSWELTLFSFILLPVSALVIGRVGKSLKRSSAKGQDKLGQLLSNIEETLSGLKIIKAFNAEDKVNDKFERENNDYRKIMTRLYRKKDLASPLSELLGAFVMVALVWFGGNLVFENADNGGMTGEKFIGFIIVFSQLLRPVQGVANAYTNISKGIASVERINVILEAEDTITEKENAAGIKSFEQEMEFKNVSFAYQTENVLNSINITIRKGQTIALVGESGGGKSTIADLIPRFYDCTDGSIQIDGKDTRDLKIKELRGLMGIVSQESILFNDSVHNNIAFGVENATKEQVIEAAKIANAHGFIKELENGYNSNIGDRGNKLSGGQKQRLSIARAVLKNPPILILDEATSALDTESEKLVQEALEKLMQNRTSIVIAHRLSTIQHADEIIVLQKGEIVERGTHNQLIESNGVYRKLSELQSFA